MLPLSVCPAESSWRVMIRIQAADTSTFLDKLVGFSEKAGGALI
ncbi:hypothetical protein C942_03613 [Photobacterium marinum]|uniref:Uncharacterized protein n=1 Tax=Photobacterium marinum TaxID=1056511 RepID=L8J4A3_9GAMM|nr:hypothetical protein C942_03613 [Photobacterium marinum]